MPAFSHGERENASSMGNVVHVQYCIYVVYDTTRMRTASPSRRQSAARCRIGFVWNLLIVVDVGGLFTCDRSNAWSRAHIRA